MSGTDLLLHGFAGTGRSWDAVIQAAGEPHWRPNAPDLPGHGGAAGDSAGGIPGLAASLAAAYGPVETLAGYSMGGRIALRMALDHPGCAQRLVLISTGPGIEDPGERARRAESDRELAARFGEMNPEEVAGLWLSGPLFAGDPPGVQERAREQILASEPSGLAQALRELGPGEMEPLWGRLEELELPVTLVAGERDTRYREIAERMAGAIAQAEVVVVPGAGHALPREAPGALAPLIAPAA
ncbi:MAG: alpha/beta fold hydrolase [Solirubrobacterales bacterium]